MVPWRRECGGRRMSARLLAAHRAALRARAAARTVSVLRRARRPWARRPLAASDGRVVLRAPHESGRGRVSRARALLVLLRGEAWALTRLA